MRFGVTTSMWDQIFRTEPPRETRAAETSGRGISSDVSGS